MLRRSVIALGLLLFAALLVAPPAAAALAETAVAGVVVDASGAPRPGVTVTEDRYGMGPTTTTGPTGAFVLPVAAGTKSLQLFVSEAGAPTVWDGIRLISAPFTVAISQTRNLGTLRLPPMTRKTVRVVDVNGDPVPDATISMHSTYQGPAPWADPSPWFNDQIAIAGQRMEIQGRTTGPDGGVDVLTLETSEVAAADGYAAGGMPRATVLFQNADTKVQLLTYTTDPSSTVVSGDQLVVTFAQLVASPPPTPAAPVAVRADQSASVSWPRALGNGWRVTDYTLTSSPGGKTCDEQPVYTDPVSWRCTVNGLTNGTQYNFTLTATSHVGTSPASEPSTTITPAGAPRQPAPPTAVRGDRSSLVSWPAADGNGAAVTRYTLYNDYGQVCTTTSALSCTVEGLANGWAYAFSVVATNEVGTSARSLLSNAVVPAGVPLQPSAPTALRGDQSARVSWYEVSGNGSPVTGYTVTSTPGGRTCVTTGEAWCTVEGLANGTDYSFRVVASNDVGDSASSPPSSTTTPAGVPLPPGTPTAVRGDHRATVSWPAASGNGSPVTGYTVTSTPGYQSCTTTVALTCTVEGLTNGTAYTFSVTATNDLGTSAPSPESEETTPASVPQRPLAPTAARGDRSATVSWTATAGNGVAGHRLHRHQHTG